MQYPVRWTAQRLSSPGRPDYLDTNSTSLGSILLFSSHAVITHEDYSTTFPPLSIARYSFIHLSELGHYGENENAKSSKRQQREDSNPGSLDCESGILPLSYHAPHVPSISIAKLTCTTCMLYLRL